MRSNAETVPAPRSEPPGFSAIVISTPLSGLLHGIVPLSVVLVNLRSGPPDDRVARRIRFDPDDRAQGG
jgi:hypothetical protein